MPLWEIIVSHHRDEDEADVSFDDVRCTRETDKACLCIIDGVSTWIPKSQITDNSEVWKKDDKGLLVITEWIAIKKGLI